MIVRLDVSRNEFEQALDRCWVEAVEKFAQEAHKGWRENLSFQPSSGSQATDLILHVREHADPWSVFAGALLSQYVLPAVNRMLGRDAVSLEIEQSEKPIKKKPVKKPAPKKPAKGKAAKKTKPKKK